MDGHDRVGLGFVRVSDALDDQEEMNDAILLINALVGFLSLEVILHCVGTFSEGHGVYFRLIIPVLLGSLDVSINLLSRKELGHVLVYVHSCGRDQNCDVLLMLDGYHDVLGIGVLAP